MASRSVWSGFIRFTLVAVPLKAFRESLERLRQWCRSWRGRWGSWRRSSGTVA